jgi:hypothetical protein
LASSQREPMDGATAPSGIAVPATVEAPDPTAPGPFAFADASRVRTLLTSAGFGSVEISPFDAVIGGADIEQTLKLALRLGPLGRALRERPELSAIVAGAVRGVLSRYVTHDGVLMPAAVWIVEASNG